MKLLKSIVPFAIVLFAAIPKVALSQNLVTNGSFEAVTPQPTSNIFCASFATSVAPQCSAIGWSGIYQIGRGVGAGNGVGFNIPQPDPDGLNALILQGDESISQSFSATSGGIYKLSFFAAQRSTPGFSGIQTISLEVDGGTTYSNTYSNISTSWSPFAATFGLTSGPHTLSIRGLGNGALDVTAFVDMVSVSAVPESPMTLLLSAGIACTLTVVRYRRRLTGAA